MYTVTQLKHNFNLPNNVLVRQEQKMHQHFKSLVIKTYTYLVLVCIITKVNDYLYLHQTFIMSKSSIFLIDGSQKNVWQMPNFIDIFRCIYNTNFTNISGFLRFSRIVVTRDERYRAWLLVAANPEATSFQRVATVRILNAFGCRIRRQHTYCLVQ